MLFTVVKGQSSFYEIRSLAICINIEGFNRLTFWKHFWNIRKILLLFTEDDLPLKVAEQFMFRGLVAHKSFTNKKMH